MNVNIWQITGYKGFYDYDGYEDNNIKLVVPMPSNFSKKVVEEIYFHLYKEYRTVALNACILDSIEIRCTHFYERNPEIELVDLRRKGEITLWLIKFSNGEEIEVTRPKSETLNHLCKSLENIKLVDKKELNKENVLKLNGLK